MGLVESNLVWKDDRALGARGVLSLTDALPSDIPELRSLYITFVSLLVEMAEKATLWGSCEDSGCFEFPGCAQHFAIMALEVEMFCPSLRFVSTQANICPA